MRALKRVTSKVAGKVYCGASEKGSLRQEAYASRSSSVIVGCPACFAPTALAHAKVNMALCARYILIHPIRPAASAHRVGVGFSHLQ
jgi:hypothetical protein